MKDECLDHRLRATEQAAIPLADPIGRATLRRRSRIHCARRQPLKHGAPTSCRGRVSHAAPDSSGAARCGQQLLPRRSWCFWRAARGSSSGRGAWETNSGGFRPNTRSSNARGAISRRNWSVCRPRLKPFRRSSKQKGSSAGQSRQARVPEQVHETLPASAQAPPLFVLATGLLRSGGSMTRISFLRMRR